MEIAMKFQKYVGRTVLLTFIASFTTLFLLDINVIKELKYLGPTSFNLSQYNERIYAQIFVYDITGLCMVIFGYSYILKCKEEVKALKFGFICLAISGLIWGSFGIFTLRVEDVFNTFHIFRIIFSWGLGIVGLILISVEYQKMFSPKFIQWFTFLVALIMISESIYFLFFEYNGIIGAVGWLIYMAWFFIFSFAYQTSSIQRKSGS